MKRVTDGSQLVSSPQSENHELQKNYKTELAISALKDVIAEAGFDAADLQVALGAIASAKELSLSNLIMSTSSSWIERLYTKITMRLSSKEMMNCLVSSFNWLETYIFTSQELFACPLTSSKLLIKPMKTLNLVLNNNE
tara:strand:+ start:278 stop:694 length:417 start_codon:yes stop_codon:yes gene_type:complete